MRHTFFALFDSAAEAEAAIRELEATHRPDDLRIVRHTGALASSDLLGSETQGRKGAVDGALLGAALGVLVGWLLTGPFDVIQGLRVPTILTIAVAMAICGGVTGMLAGASSPDPRLERMAAALQRGRMLVTIEVPGLTDEEKAEDVCRRHGAFLAHRPVV